MSEHGTFAGPLDGPPNLLEALLKVEDVCKNFR
jgi:hypothetical protein